MMPSFPGVKTVTAIARIVGLMLIAAAAGGCYKIDIQQGNIVDQAQLERLRVGMSKRQVQTLLGTPLLVDPFHADRWDYVYNFFPEADEASGERRHFSLYFNGDQLARIEQDSEPPLAAQ